MSRFFLKYLLLMLVLLGIIFLGVSWLTRHHHHQQALARAESVLENRKNTVVNLFAPLVTSSAYFSQSALFKSNWNSDSGREDILREMLRFAETHSYYEQVRILSSKGQELLRVNEYGDSAVIVPQAELQYKGERDYFRQAQRLKEDEIYISPLNLNIEYGKVQRPYRAVMRVIRAIKAPGSSEPLYFVTNISVENLFEAFTSSDGDPYLTLVNSNGGAVSVDAEGFQYHYDNTSRGVAFSDSLPELWKYIRSQTRGSFRVPKGEYVFSRINLAEELQQPKPLGTYDFLYPEDFELTLLKFVSYSGFPGWTGLSSEARGFLIVLLIIFLVTAFILSSKEQREQEMYSKIGELNDALIKSQYELNTDRERLEESVVQLSRRNMQLKEFSHIISHNIRSPIAGLTILVAYMRDHGEVFTQEELKEVTSKLEYSTQVLNKLADHLLETVNLLERGRVPTEELHLRDSIEKAQDILVDQIIEVSPEIVIDLEAWERLTYHKSYLDSIILNLMSNALEYRAPERPLKIEIRTARKGNNKVLYFKDNGRGINLQWHKDNIFGLHKTFHSDKAGEGLGLFMTRTQIEAMGGLIEVESEEGVGTTFIINF